MPTKTKTSTAPKTTKTKTTSKAPKAPSMKMSGNLEDLAILFKVLGAQRNGKSLGDRNLINKLGHFRVRGVLSYDIAGTVGQDYQQAKYFGVKIDDLFNLMVALIPGFTEDYARKACAILLEIERAKLEKRRLNGTHWTDSNGALRILERHEVCQAKERMLEMAKKAKEITGQFSKEIKVTRDQRGPISITDASLELSTSEEDTAA